MKDIIFDTLLDSIKLLPFLFLAFLLMELLEHKFSKFAKSIMSKSGKFGPILGSMLGIVPQCGFSVLATNFYITRVISIGTLISIYLSTSDEMLPILISSGVSFNKILIILSIKFVCGMLFGFLVDFLFKNKFNNGEIDYHLCNKEHCDCDHGIIKSSIIHTFNILFYIFLISFILNIILSYCGENLISKIFMKNTVFGPFLGSLIGLIPNCGASVILTEMYLNSVINLGTCISGLLTGSGISLLFLFKSNRNIKENIFIIFILYGIGVIVGIILEMLGILL